MALAPYTIEESQAVDHRIAPEHLLNVFKNVTDPEGYGISKTSRAALRWNKTKLAVPSIHTPADDLSIFQPSRPLISQNILLPPLRSVVRAVCHTWSIT